MADLVLTGQRYVHAAGNLLRRNRFEGGDRPWNYAKGERQVANLAEQIEQASGLRLEGRRVLDFGCGGGRLAVPLATRTAHVTGLDVDAGALRRAAASATEAGVENVAWGEAEGLAEMAGRYDLLLSINVFQHVPSREGERLLAQLVRGLQPGGIGAVQLILRPAFRLSRMWSRTYLYHLMNSYSLNRVGRVLREQDVRRWSVIWRGGPAGEHGEQRELEDVLLVFVKPAADAPALDGD
jgi:2-polyprenyl-3-methyl-5-hydroxy-6-metoxy-1,4-benzoquinol methylase